jgi:hypothetical protein
VNDAEKSKRHSARGQQARSDLGRAVRARVAHGPSHEPDAPSETHERGPRGPEKSTAEPTQHAAEKGERTSTADACATANAEDLAPVAPAQRMVRPSMKGVRAAREPIDAARNSRGDAIQDEGAARSRTAVP